MPRRLRIDGRFPTDLTRAIVWYGEQSPAVRERFKAAVRETLRRIESNPAAYAVAFDTYRAAMTGRFPYLVLYRFDDHELRILALIHAASRPERWGS
jgi:plasmid stabilization system protein ParE